MCFIVVVMIAGRGKQFSSKDSDRLQRNELKFNDAKKEFVECNKLVAKRLYEQWRARFTVIDPLFNELVKTEAMFVSAINNQFQGILPEMKQAMSKPLKLEHTGSDINNNDIERNSDTDTSVVPDDGFNETSSRPKFKPRTNTTAIESNDIDIDSLQITNKSSRRDTMKKSSSAAQTKSKQSGKKKVVVSDSESESSDDSSSEDDEPVPVPVPVKSNNKSNRRQTAPLFDDAFLNAAVSAPAQKQQNSVSADLFDVFATNNNTANNNTTSTMAPFNVSFDAFNTSPQSAPPTNNNGYSTQQQYQQPYSTQQQQQQSYNQMSYNQPPAHNRQAQSMNTYDWNNQTRQYQNQPIPNQYQPQPNNDSFNSFAPALSATQQSYNSQSSYSAPSNQLTLMPVGARSYSHEVQSPFDDLMATIEKQNAQQLGVTNNAPPQYNAAPVQPAINQPYAPPPHHRAPSYSNNNYSMTYAQQQYSQPQQPPYYHTSSNAPTQYTPPVQSNDDPFASIASASAPPPQPAFNRTPSMSNQYNTIPQQSYQPIQQSILQSPTPQFSSFDNLIPNNSINTPIRTYPHPSTNNISPQQYQSSPVSQQPFDVTQPFSSASSHQDVPPISTKPIDKAVFESFDWD